MIKETVLLIGLCLGMVTMGTICLTKTNCTIALVQTAQKEIALQYGPYVSCVLEGNMAWVESPMLVPVETGLFSLYMYRYFFIVLAGAGLVLAGALTYIISTDYQRLVSPA